MGNQLFSGRKSLHAMETNLFDPEAVLANEVFPRDSPRPDFLGSLNRVQARFSSPDDLENRGRATRSEGLTNQTGHLNFVR